MARKAKLIGDGNADALASKRTPANWTAGAHAFLAALATADGGEGQESGVGHISKKRNGLFVNNCFQRRW
jgi:hypothetical protein